MAIQTAVWEWDPRFCNFKKFVLPDLNSVQREGPRRRAGEGHPLTTTSFLNVLQFILCSFILNACLLETTRQSIFLVRLSPFINISDTVFLLSSELYSLFLLTGFSSWKLLASLEKDCSFVSSLVWIGTRRVKSFDFEGGSVSFLGEGGGGGRGGGWVLRSSLNVSL